MRAFPLVDIVASRRDRAGAVAHYNVLVRNAHRFDQRCAGNCRGARTVHDDLDVLDVAVGEVAGVEQAGGGDDRGAVLVIVHDRDVHPLAQGGFDDEAFGRLDVLKVDPAKARLHQRDRFDERFRVFGRELDIDRVDVGEAFEEHSLALHHRLGGQRAEIAEA